MTKHIAKPVDDCNVVALPQPGSPEEQARRLKMEVERLASLPSVEWLFYLETDGVAETHGLIPARRVDRPCHPLGHQRDRRTMSAGEA